MNTKAREAADSFLDGLAEIIENSVQSEKYQLDSSGLNMSLGHHLDGI